MLEAALNLAVEWRLSFYDATYLALALDRGGRLYTCDDLVGDVARKLGVA